MSSNRSELYVREEMLPESEPPAMERGLAKWARENLFSSWMNIALTVISAAFIAWVLSHLVPWFWYGVWQAGSLTECREISNAAYGHTHGACWGVIRDRWHQLLFGFYPQHLYLRPILAFALLFVALAPVLFNNVPRQLLWFTGLYPFAAYFLLWGGSVWGPVAALLGFVAVGYCFSAVADRRGLLIGFLAALVLFLFYFADPISSIVWLLMFPISLFAPEAAAVPVDLWTSISPFGLSGVVFGVLDAVVPVGIEAVPSDDFGGFMLALIIGLTGIAFSLPIGILLALGRQSNLFLIRTICVGFIEFIRGVPLITLLFVASVLLAYFLPRGVTFDLILRVIIMVTLFASAYMAEVIRGGLAALPRGQYEAADALGLDYWKAQRLIIMPQALKISIPGIVNTFIGLFKDTTLVVFVGLQDPIGFSNLIRATTDWNGIYWELFVFIAALFFICCFSMSRYSMYLERRLKTDR